MKPFAILSLVLIALAGLGLALFALLGGGAAEHETPIAPAMPRAAAGDAAAAALANSEPGVARLPQIATAPEGERTEIATAEASFENRLIGTVFDPDRRPLAGARVRLSEGSSTPGLQTFQQILLSANGATPPPTKTWSTTSDEQGAFVFRSVPAGANYTLVCEHARFARAEVPLVQVPPDGERREDVVMRAGLVLWGNVTDENGAPVDGAQVVIENSMYQSLPAGAKSPERQEQRTQPDGTFRFENVGAGNRFALVTARGFGSQSAPNLQFNAGDEPKQQDFRLSRGLSIAGTVVGPDLAPIGGASIQVVSYDLARPSSGQASSAPTGRFEVSDLAPGKYMLIVHAAGFNDERFNHIEAGERNLQVQLFARGGAQGRVVDKSSGAPVSSFTVAARPMTPGATTLGRPASSRTIEGSADGSFVLGDLQDGAYVIEATAQGYAPTRSAQFNVQQGLITPDVVIELSQGATIVGRVVDARTGDPVAGAEIETFDNGFVRNPFTDLLGSMMPRNTTQRVARTDRDGRFAIEMVIADVYQLQVRHARYTTAQLLDLRLAEGETLELGNVELQSGATLRGTVYGPDGLPLPNASVSVRGNRGAGSQYEGRSDAEGHYMVQHAAEGQYVVSARRPQGPTPNPFDSIVDMKNSEVTVVLYEGQETTLDLFLAGR